LSTFSSSTKHDSWALRFHYYTLLHVITYYYRKRGAKFLARHEWSRHGQSGVRNHAYASEIDKSSKPAKSCWRKGEILRAYAPAHSFDHQVPQCASVHRCWSPPPACLLSVPLKLLLEHASWPLQWSWPWTYSQHPAKIREGTRNDDILLFISAH